MLRRFIEEFGLFLIPFGLFLVLLVVTGRNPFRLHHWTGRARGSSWPGCSW